MNKQTEKKIDPSRMLQRLKPRPAPAPRRVQIEPLPEDEPRRSRRNTACVQAVIVSPRLKEDVPCVVRDSSATGARLEMVKPERKAFAPTPVLPDIFTLRYRLERIEVDCQVVWIKGGRVGVRFVSLPERK